MKHDITLTFKQPSAAMTLRTANEINWLTPLGSLFLVSKDQSRRSNNNTEHFYRQYSTVTSSISTRRLCSLRRTSSLLKINTGRVCVSSDDIIFSWSSCVFSESLLQERGEHWGETCQKQPELQSPLYISASVLSRKNTAFHAALSDVQSVCCATTCGVMNYTVCGCGIHRKPYCRRDLLWVTNI